MFLERESDGKATIEEGDGVISDAGENERGNRSGGDPNKRNILFEEEDIEHERD